MGAGVRRIRTIHCPPKVLLNATPSVAPSSHLNHFLSLFRVKIVIKIAIKMVGSLIVVLLAAAVGTQAAKLTSTGVALEPIFDFLDDDGSNTVSTDELKALTTTGDADGSGEVTALEFETAWGEIATTFGVPAEKHAKYFKLVDGVDGSAEDG